MLNGTVHSSTNVECKSNKCTLNATVNSTTNVECKSNCTPIRLFHVKSRGSSEKSIGTPTDVYIGNDQYSVKATIKLDVSYNNSWIECKNINTPDMNSKVEVLLQGYTCLQILIMMFTVCCFSGSLLPVSDLKVTSNVTHIHFSWLSPSVLGSIEVIYKVQFHCNGISLYNQTVNETLFVIPFNYSCHSSSFGVAPMTGMLEGKTQYITHDCAKG